MRNILQQLNCPSWLTLILLFIGFPSIVVAIPKIDVHRGSLVAEGANGLVLAMPLVSTDVTIKVTGPIARTTIQQKFENNSDQWIEALYLFPLPENAAVDHMRIGQTNPSSRLAHIIHAGFFSSSGIPGPILQCVFGKSSSIILGYLS